MAVGPWVRRGGIVASAVLVALSLVFVPFASSPAKAANGADFIPGKIITDQNMHDTTTMNAGQIQSFLQSKELNCQTGYSCLKDYRVDTASRSADGQCAAFTGQASEPASSIIWRVGLACGINPQVLLVLLEKEQGLVSSTAPSSARYTSATGYNCPDSTGCSTDPKYGGLYNQLYWAAWQFQYYEKHTSSFNYYAPGAVHNIAYNTAAYVPPCGSASVYVENQATADLYYYTPYTPDAAALANLYGTGGGCSAYGNRNFWRIYSDWFGSPSGPRSAFGSLEGAYAVIGGIEVGGWSFDPYSNGTQTYVWINVDGLGGPAFANLPSDVADTYPAQGPNHGFDTVVSASPGTHQVCVYNTVLLGCQTVTVTLSPNAAGAIDSASAVIGSVSVTGWSLDTRTTASTFVWINVDGTGGPVVANLADSASTATNPTVGGNHGFSFTTPASTGVHVICVYGTDSVSLGCKRVTVPSGAHGSFDTATGVTSGVHLVGWSLDLATPGTSTYLWINVDGVGGAGIANVPLNWIAGYFAPTPVGSNHGFDITIAASPGTHQICIYGSGSTPLGCKTVTVPATNHGSFDTATGIVGGGINVTGWNLNLTTPSTPTFIWINVDGTGGPGIANVPLNWIDGAFPGAGVGPNHGFNTTIAASPGTHQICIYGSGSTPLGCKTVTLQ